MKARPQIKGRLIVADDARPMDKDTLCRLFWGKTMEELQKDPEARERFQAEEEEEAIT